MSEFKQYKRKSISEMKPVPSNWTLTTLKDAGVSVSQADLDNGSPKVGDMIARNPKNHKDQWLVAKEYFEDNLEPFGGNTNLTFGLAIEALKQGKRVARKGWNGKGMFIYIQDFTEYNKIADKCYELQNCISMFTATKEWQPGWLASQMDILAEDWCIVE
jgi:hypothetical protein